MAPRTVKGSGRGSASKTGKRPGASANKASSGRTAAKKTERAAAVRGAAKTSDGKRFAGDALDRLVLSERAAWRAWLEKNHTRDVGVWLVSFKKATGKPRVGYDESVEEALCFGWIDSTERSVDESRLMQLFTPRRPRSAWSQSNKARVERLIAAGLMRPAGQAKIEQARQDGSWDTYAVVESLEVPADLEAAFTAGPATARSSWEAFSPASRRAILWWVHSAKRPETRARRVAEVVSEAAKKRRANFPEDRRA